MRELTIEYPMQGSTYSEEKYGVYEYGVYPRSSVLAGQTKRVFLDSFETLEEAQRAFPDAVVVEGSGFSEPSLSHLPDDDDY